MFLMVLSCAAVGALCASDKKEVDVKWEQGVTPGNAVLLRVNRQVGKFLIYEGTLAREQRAVNSFTEDTAFYLNVYTADKRDGLDLVTIQRSYTDRKRVEMLESKQKRVMDALPLSNEQVNLGPNFDLVGVLRCYAHSTQNAIAYRTDQLLVLKDGSQLRGQIINETDEKLIFLTDTEKFDIVKANVISVETIEKPHVCIADTPHYLFPIFSARPVAPGDTWRFRVPVVIPIDQGGPQRILPTQFTARLVGRLREVRNGVATVDYQVSGEFDSAKEEFRNRFPEQFHQDNHQVHTLTGTGVLTLDIEKGRVLSKEETFTFSLLGTTVVPAPAGQEAKKQENHVDVTSRFSMKLVQPGARLKTGAVVPDYDTGVVPQPSAEDKEKEAKDAKKEKEKDKKKKK